jgi:hypothetical protein
VIIFVAAETSANEPLSSKMTSATAGIPAFTQCLPSRCLPMDVCSGSIIPVFNHHVTILTVLSAADLCLKQMNELLNFIQNAFHKFV